jgi:hypothetical protein
VMGGKNANDDSFNNAEAYTPSTNSWRILSVMPTARRYFAAGAISGVLYTVGGCCINNAVLAINQAYTP